MPKVHGKARVTYETSGQRDERVRKELGLPVPGQWYAYRTYAAGQKWSIWHRAKFVFPTGGGHNTPIIINCCGTQVDQLDRALKARIYGYFERLKETNLWSRPKREFRIREAAPSKEQAMARRWWTSTDRRACRTCWFYRNRDRRF